MKRSHDDVVQALKWLETRPTLEALRQKYPDDWHWVEKELATAVEVKDHARLHALMRPIESASIKRGMRLKPTEAVRITRALIRQRMAATAIQQFVREALPEGSIRAGWSDRLLFRRLFFTRQHQRKIVSETAFRLLWPLVRRPSALMPLAEANGIYGFFTARFVSALAGRIDGSCLEIGAGDGALARCLRDAGADIVATDDYSWSGKIDYPPEVQKLPAVEALSQYRPESVLCSWPPGGNPFEAAVFETPSVRRYIVIGSRHQFAFGNWRSYRAQAAFSMQLDEALSGMLLPPDFGGAVYIFDRRSMVV